MDVYSYQACLDDPANFRRGGLLHCLDIAWINENSAEHEVKIEILPDDKIQQWIESPPCGFRACSSGKERSTPTRSGPSLRVIAVQHPSPQNGLQFTQAPYPLAKSDYETIVTHFKISPLLLPAALNLDAVFFKHCDVSQGSAKPERRVQHVFRSCSAGKGRFALGLTYHPDKMQTTALLSGLNRDQIEEIFSRLESFKIHVAAPMLLPSILAGSLWSLIKERMQRCHEITNAVREKIGFPRSLERLEYREPSTAENVRLSKSLATILEKLAKYNQQCAGLLAFFRVLEESNQACIDETPEPQKDTVVNAVSFVQSMNLYVVSSTQSFLLWIEYLHRRAQAYVQTVYGLIAQGDNALNVQMAEASLRIAESSRDDNVAMKTIAEDSKAVAVASLRKNVTMRTIAVVTMLFLPATFVATLFSTTFFNFQASSGPVVSRWIWLYVLVTAVMTVAIQGLWFYNTRQKDRDIDKVLSGIYEPGGSKRHDNEAGK